MSVGEAGFEPAQPKRGLYRPRGSPMPSSPLAEEVGVEPTRALACPNGFRDRGRRHLSAGSSVNCGCRAESARIERARGRPRRRLSKPLPCHSANSPGAALPDEDSNPESPDPESGVLPVAPSGTAGGRQAERPPGRGSPPWAAGRCRTRLPRGGKSPALLGTRRTPIRLVAAHLAFLSAGWCRADAHTLRQSQGCGQRVFPVGGGRPAGRRCARSPVSARDRLIRVVAEDRFEFGDHRAGEFGFLPSRATGCQCRPAASRREHHNAAHRSRAGPELPRAGRSRGCAVHRRVR